MKASYSNGVLSSFEEAGLRDWDVVMGTSAGGALAAWFSARQSKRAEETWAYAQDKRVLSYRRLLVAGPVLDHEALLEIVYRDELPIDQEAIHRAPWRVVVTAADIESGSCVYQDIRNQDIIAWIKATGRMPIGCGPPVEIGGRRYIDGGAIDPIPVRHAVEIMGMTRVTLILNTPAGPRRPDARLLAEMAARRYPQLRDGILRHNAIKDAAIQYALDPPAGVQIDVIRPAASFGVHRLSRDLDAIGDAMEAGRRDGQAYIASLAPRHFGR